MRLRCEPGWSVVEVEGRLGEDVVDHVLTWVWMGLTSRDRLFVDLRHAQVASSGVWALLGRASAEADRRGKRVTVLEADPQWP